MYENLKMDATFLQFLNLRMGHVVHKILVDPAMAGVFVLSS